MNNKPLSSSLVTEEWVATTSQGRTYSFPMRAGKTEEQVLSFAKNTISKRTIRVEKRETA